VTELQSRDFVLDVIIIECSLPHCGILKSIGSIVSTIPRLWDLDDVGGGSNSGRNKSSFSSSKHRNWLYQPLFNGNQGSFLEVKWPGCEGDHSPPSSNGVKNGWSYASFPAIHLHGADRDNLYLKNFCHWPKAE
jgi:hypothetical protein